MAGISFPYFNIVQSQLQYLEFCLSLFRTLAVARSMGDTRLEMIGLGHRTAKLLEASTSIIHGRKSMEPLLEDLKDLEP
jgi:hypothetical protein